MGLIAGVPDGQYVTSEVGIGGAIKDRPEDFVVEELPLYEPCGEGEHLYLGIEKQGVAHGELLAVLRRHFDVRDPQIGYAGMKDKHAVTRQMVSVHLHDDPPSIDLQHDRIKVLWADRHRNRLKRGHLRGNRFTIRVRDADPIAAVRAATILKSLRATGVPGFYGEQRFGYRANNQVIGGLLLQDRWDDVVTELLGTGGTPYPDYQQERRELHDAGRHAEAAEHWTRADRTELIVARALGRGIGAQEAIRSVGRTTLNFYTSAWASALFNEILAERLETDTLAELTAGDLAWKHDSRAVFRVGEDDVAGGELVDRLARFEISPSGPLWGADMMRAARETGDREQAALDRSGISFDRLRSSRYRPEGARRPLRTPLSGIDVEGGVDEHGSSVTCSFELDRGMYATVVMREVMKVSDST